MRWKVIAGLVLGASMMSRVAVAQSDYPSDMGYGVLAVVANVFYMPAKVTYAALGGVTGCFAYVLTLGDMDTVEKIWSPTLGGSYVITPAMLRDDEPILFSTVLDDEDEE